MKHKLFLLVWLLVAGSAWAAIAVDGTPQVLGSANQTTGNSFTLAYTVGAGSNRVLVALIGMVSVDTIPTTCNWNTSEAMKMVAAPIRDYGGSELRNFIYAIVNPTSGTHNIVCNLSGTLGSGNGDFGSMSAVAFTGVHQTYPFRLPSLMFSGTDATQTAPTCSSGDALSGDYIVGTTVTHTSTITQGASQTAINSWGGWNTANNTSWATSYIPAATRASLIWGANGGAAVGVYSCSAVVLRPDTDTPIMPVLDNPGQTATSGGSAVSSVTISNFVMGTGTNSILTYWAAYYTGSGVGTRTINSVAFGAQSLARCPSVENRVTAFSGSIVVDCWYKLNPTPGTANIVATFSGNIAEFISGADSWFLVAQTGTFGTPKKASNTTGAAVSTGAVTSQTGAIVHDIEWHNAAGANFPTGSMSFNMLSAPAESSGGAQVKKGDTSVTMNWTGSTTQFNIVGVGINFGAPATAVKRNRVSVINQ